MLDGIEIATGGDTHTVFSAGPLVTPRQFSDLAVAVARHAGDLSCLAQDDQLALHRVWKRAMRCFGVWREEVVSSATPKLYAEFFAAELPIRVWCTAVSAGNPQEDASGPAIAGKVFGELLDLRCLMLQALAADHGLSTVEAATVDRFRRRCERWADVLLGTLVARGAAPDFAFCADRAHEFAKESRDDPDGAAVWPLVTAGTHLAFASADTFRGESTEESMSAAADLAAAIFAGYPHASFSADGRLRAPRVGRVARTIRETSYAKPRRSVDRTPAPPASAPPLDAPRAPHAISFSSLRKRRDSN